MGRVAACGLAPVAESDCADFQLDTAVVAVDHARRANGREAAFGQPQPAGLLARAAPLRALGVQVLMVVPQTDQPVRTGTVARVAACLAAHGTAPQQRR